MGWFKAFHLQDPSIRDYRPYFRPNLCYLEGGWTVTSRDKLEEPFASDRHHLEASSWADLADKIRYTSYTGQMSVLENLAFLPTAIFNVSSTGAPQSAQWNYRILCHPLKNDLPTSLFKLQDDLAHRLARDRPLDKMALYRG